MLQIEAPKVTYIEAPETTSELTSALTPTSALTSGTTPTLEIEEEDCIFVLDVVSEYTSI